MDPSLDHVLREVVPHLPPGSTGVVPSCRDFGNILTVSWQGPDGARYLAERPATEGAMWMLVRGDFSQIPLFEWLTEQCGGAEPAPAAEGRRLTPADLEAEITDEHYFTAGEAADYAPNAKNTVSVPGQFHPSLAHLTFCVLVLRNGCKVVGINHGPVDPAGFDPEHGRKDAREDAIRQVWPLLGFRLRDRLHRESEAARVVATIDWTTSDDAVPRAALSGIADVAP